MRDPKTPHPSFSSHNLEAALGGEISCGGAWTGRQPSPASWLCTPTPLLEKPDPGSPSGSTLRCPRLMRETTGYWTQLPTHRGSSSGHHGQRAGCGTRIPPHSPSSSYLRINLVSPLQSTGGCGRLQSDLVQPIPPVTHAHESWPPALLEMRREYAASHGSDFRQL